MLPKEAISLEDLRKPPIRLASLCVLSCTLLLPCASAQAISILPAAPSALIDLPLHESREGAATGFGAQQQGPLKSYMSSEKETPVIPERPAPTGFPRFPTPSQQHAREEIERNTDCEEHIRHGKACRVSWARVIGESAMFLSAQHGGNIYMDDDTRNALNIDIQTGQFWSRYIYCIDHYRYNRWKDDDPFGVDYIGHPMMGAMTNSIYEQNDPKQRALMFENTRRYWMGRLRATAYSAVYSAQWKVGPISEASVGNTGIGYYIRARDGIRTNETGMQDFFITPIGGLAWNVGEDAIDRFIFQHVRHAQTNKGLLFVASFMTPLKAGANIARFRAPYYRDVDETSAGMIHWKPE